jgi:hypothetical protein
LIEAAFLICYRERKVRIHAVLVGRGDDLLLDIAGRLAEPAGDGDYAVSSKHVCGRYAWLAGIQRGTR